MEATPTVYVICDQNCKFEGMTKEQILTAIVQAVENGTIGDIDTGFITTIKTINGTPLKFFVGEQAAYDALTDEEKNNLFAIITNDTTKAGIIATIEELQTNYKELRDGLVDGSFVVAKATSATSATKATNDGSGNNIASTYAKKTDIEDGSIVAAKATTATELEIDETYFSSVDTSGKNTSVFKAGRSYLITAGMLDEDTSNVVETMLLSVPTLTSINAIHSTPTRAGYYCRVVMNATPLFKFYNNSDTAVTAAYVSIREI